MSEENKIERIHLYSTASKWIIFGSDLLSKNFQILQISRDKSNCEIVTDEQIYTAAQVDQTLRMYESANLVKVGFSCAISNLTKTHKTGPSIIYRRSIISLKILAQNFQVTAGFGIIGMVAFFNGFYLLIIKSRQKVAEIKGKSIYKIIQTESIYIPGMGSLLMNK